MAWARKLSNLITICLFILETMDLSSNPTRIKTVLNLLLSLILIFVGYNTIQYNTK
jgi:hypothetical protein